MQRAHNKLVLEIFNCFEIYLGFVWQKLIFIQNKIIKIGLKVCLSNNPLGQKSLNKKIINQTKPKYLTQKINQSGWLENTGSTLN